MANFSNQRQLFLNLVQEIFLLLIHQNPTNKILKVKIMHEYNAPMKDMRFVLYDVLDITEHLKLIDREDIDTDLINAIVEEGAKFCSGITAPLNQIGDEMGASFKNGSVTTPSGFKEAYTKYCDTGWAAMTGPVEYDGQGFPQAVASSFHEMMMSSNLAFRIYSGLTEGVVLALRKHGSDSLKTQYLPKLVTGHWSGTMCLTEPQAGTDLALLSTKASNINKDGSYLITGTKIFISGGDHDMADNIAHLVLARLPSAPLGVKGISLFLVPKYLPNADGSLGELNTLNCGSIESKMGIKGAATCVMNFDGAQGWLVGEPHAGLKGMFTMMNDARYQVGLQGLGLAEMSYQGSLIYEKERLQSRSLTGVKSPETSADPIIVHPDVRRMLLTQKSLVEGCRMLGYYAGSLIDLENCDIDDKQTKNSKVRAAFLIPLVKGFLTDMSMEVCNIGVQVFGGHGYIKEWGMEQLIRDARITQLYEGANGIQALDFVRRKLLVDHGQCLDDIANEILQWCEQHDQTELCNIIEKLKSAVQEWQTTADFILTVSEENPDEIGAVSVDFMHGSSYVLLGYFWARAAIIASKVITGELDDSHVKDIEFLQGKVDTANFYFHRILPRMNTHFTVLKSGAETLMSIDVSSF
ncbi:MAG: alkylation response protein AidB-like acyl-CoA dehydrogenase [Francisellaceae bacterium]|jgi:alkylation response protein AidB-like acyl-CoA dehydrogenase